jgi:MFS family permease
MSAGRPLSRKASFLVGVACAAVGIAIVLVSVFADSTDFHAPRWVVGGRIAFGLGALLVDALLVACVARLVRQMLRAPGIREPAPRTADPLG